MPRNPHKTHCTFPGCRGWAMRGQQRCYVHRHHVPRPPPSGATSGTPGSSLASSPGTPPPSLAQPDPEAQPAQPDPSPATPPARSLRPSEDSLASSPGTPRSSVAQPDPEAQPPDPDPDPSILGSHLAALEQRLSALDAHVRRLDAQLEHDPALLPAYTRLLNLQGQLTSRLSRLLRERQQIAETAAQDLIRSATDDALDQASVILGVDL